MLAADEIPGAPEALVLRSDKINRINDAIQRSTLWDDPGLRRKVLGEACPRVLIALVGMETILERVPENYLRAIVGARMASSFVYQHGMNAGEVAFFEFVQPYLDRVRIAP